MVRHLLALHSDLLRLILRTPDETRASSAVCSLRTALLRGSLCRQLRALLLQPGSRIPVAVDEHHMVPVLPSMRHVPRCFEIVVLKVEELSCVSAYLFTAAALAQQLQRLVCLELQDCTLHHGRYSLLLEHLPALQHFDLLDVRIEADPNRDDELYVFGDWQRSTIPPLRRFTAFNMSRRMVVATPPELRAQWPASLVPFLGGLQHLGLTLSHPDNMSLHADNLFFGALMKLQLDVRCTVLFGTYVAPWQRVPVLEELAVQLSLPNDSMLNTQSLCRSFVVPMPRLRELRIISPVSCVALVRVFGASEQVAHKLPAMQMLYLGGHDDIDTRGQAQALLPAIFVKFPLAHSMTISQSGRRAGPLPLVVAGF